MTLDRRTANFLDLLEGDGLGWANRLSFVSSFSAIQSRDFLRVRLASVRKRYIRPLAAEDVFHGIRSCGRLSSRKKKRRPVLPYAWNESSRCWTFLRVSLSCAHNAGSRSRYWSVALQIKWRWRVGIQKEKKRAILPSHFFQAKSRFRLFGRPFRDGAWPVKEPPIELLVIDSLSSLV